MTYLILRLSTLGNVAMTVPVIASLSARYPEDQFIVVSKKRLSAMFYGMPNVQFHEVATDGIAGMWHLYQTLRDRYAADAVIDLQDVTSTRLLRGLFRIAGKRIYTIDYGRWKKHKVIRFGRGGKPLPSEFERYAATFRKAGLTSDDGFTALAVDQDAAHEVRQRFGQKSGKWIGIAPFAKSKSNMLPYRTTKGLIQQLTQQTDVRLFLFGAGQIECEMLRQWASIFPRVSSVAGELPLSQELELMRQLDVMVCMDSANQHLSSLVGLRAVSIWCATDPCIGFMGWKQNEADIVQLKPLKCRPCTCHGTNHCRFRNFACRNINIEQIIQRIETI
ncbi:MAG: glycosyltransferase family 9 protein [Paludibacteraceae bacterium]